MATDSRAFTAMDKALKAEEKHRQEMGDLWSKALTDMAQTAKYAAAYYTTIDKERSELLESFHSNLQAMIGDSSTTTTE